MPITSETTQPIPTSGDEFERGFVVIPREEYERLVKAVNDVKRFIGVISGKVEDVQAMVKLKP